MIMLIVNLGLLAQGQLDLQKIVQIKKARYELSSFAIHPELGIVCVQDEKSTVSKLDSTTWKLKTVYQPKIDNSDLEGIEVCNSAIYILNERNSKVYFVNENKAEELKVDYKNWEAENKTDLHIDKWRNAGYEGFAIDCKNQKLYLAKERKAKNIDDGRFIFEVDIKTEKILRKIEIKAIASNPDFADVKFEERDGMQFLYVLERNSYTVVRLNLSTNEIMRYSFAKIAASEKNQQNLYITDHEEFGIAEALLLTKTQIWIGVDNNQEKVNKNNKWVKKYNLKGNAPAIMIFTRPEGF